MNIYEERYTSRLRDQCIFQHNQAACNQLKAYEAIARIIVRLEDALNDIPIHLPLGPDPAPEGRLTRDQIRDRLMSGDLDGSPFFPVSNVISKIEKAKDRSNIARKVQGSLQNVLSQIDQDIAQLEKASA